MNRAPAVGLVVRDGSSPARFGADELRHALDARNVAVQTATFWSATAAPRLVLAGLVTDPQIAAVLEGHLETPPAGPEGIVRATLDVDGRTTLLLAGTDARGLMYALLDEADAVRCGASELLSEPPNQRNAYAEVSFPSLKIRSASLSVMSEEGDRDWLFSTEFWETYLGMLARARFNRISLILGHHTAYMSPPYPYFVQVAGYPDVYAEGVGEAERQAYLDMLRRVSAAASARGIDFYLGIWQQKPWADQQASLVGGLAPADLTGYCRAAVAALLAECPDISGLELRVNRESGVEGQADAFWEEFFRGVAECGRRVELDVRAKGMTDGILQAALDTGFPVTVSTKYWCEHMGLPYHPTLQQSPEFNAPATELDRKRRYSYADLLHNPKSYQVMYRLWSYGSNRVFLWGDAGYAARFARSCTFGGGQGFELMGPLTCKGGMNEPGVWRITRDASEQFCR